MNAFERVASDESTLSYRNLFARSLPLTFNSIKRVDRDLLKTRTANHEGVMGCCRRAGGVDRKK
jgi:hypothetical protein